MGSFNGGLISVRLALLLFQILYFSIKFIDASPSLSGEREKAFFVE